MKNNQLFGGSVALLSPSEMVQISGGGWFKDLVNGFKDGWNCVLTIFFSYKK